MSELKTTNTAGSDSDRKVAGRWPEARIESKCQKRRKIKGPAPITRGAAMSGSPVTGYVHALHVLGA